MLFILLSVASLVLSVSLPVHASGVQSVLVFGDSLSAGYGLEKGQEWPALLQQRFGDRQLIIQVHNHSISGETTRGGLTRLARSLESSQPDIVILELGANDGLRGLSLKVMRQNLQQMIDLVVQHPAEVLLVGMHLPENYGQGYTGLFHRQFVSLARENELAFLPFLMDGLAIGLDMYQADGLHPTAAAQPQMMENVWEVLEPMLDRPAL